MRGSVISALLAVASGLLGLSAAQSYPLPEPCAGPACANPPGAHLDYQDFSVIRRKTDGKYFRFAKSNSSGHGLSVATAPKLRGPWYYQGEILTTLTEPFVSNRSDTDVWAPDVKFVNGKYHLFYTIHTNQHSTQRNYFDLCVATSPSLDLGTWTDLGSMGLPKSPYDPVSYERIDGNLIANSSDPTGVQPGTQYMAFGSYNWGLYDFQVTPNLTRYSPGASVDILVADQYVPADKGTHNRTEGAYRLIHNNYIYLFYSLGNCCTYLGLNETSAVYRVEVCRAPAGSPKGPYVDKTGKDCSKSGNGSGSIILASQPDGSVFAPGSIGILNDTDEGGLVMYYQYFNITGQREAGLRFGFNYLQFGSDGWPAVVAKRS